MPAPPVLELTGITKAYGPVLACDGVDLRVERGQVHGLLGENGAGKSTLMKVLVGLAPADAGTLARDGRLVRVDSPRRAADLGIAMVHQHLSLVEPLRVWENVALTDGGNIGGRVNRDRVCAEVEQVGARYGLAVDPLRTVADLSPAARQRVELVRCLRRDPAVLVLDEPTSVLTAAESAGLFAVLREVVAAGDRGVVLISHTLAEVTAATDVVTVLRRGRVVFRSATAATDAAELARQVVGREVAQEPGAVALGLVPDGARQRPAPAPVPAAAPALAVAGLALRAPDGRLLLDGLSLEVAPGEVLALYGVEGNGQSALGDVLSGLVVPDAGSVQVAGREVDLRAVGALRAAGVGVVPEDRDRGGVVLDMSVLENLVMTDLGRVSGRLLVHRGRARALARELVDRFAIDTPSLDTPVRHLSGGNQQRVVLARELSGDPGVLVAAQPARGLDVGAALDVHERLRAVAARGVGVLLVSTELDEVLALADRIAVLSAGRVVGVLPVARATPQRLGLLVGGQVA